MLRHARALTALLLASLLVAGVSAQSRPAPAARGRLDAPVTQLIVQLRQDSALAGQAAAQPEQVADQLGALAEADLQYAYAAGVSGAHLLTLPAPVSVADAEAIAARIAASPEVAYAEPERLVYPALVPSDPLYSGSMWHLQPVNAVGLANSANNYGANLPPAWDITTGSASIVTAVVDTGGLLTHEDLAGRMPAGNAGYDMISNSAVANDGGGRDNNPADPGDWVAADELEPGDPLAALGCGNTNDSSWHGSHVGGTIGASANNGKGVTGINWNSNLIFMRALGKCGGFPTDIADAVRWAAGLPVAGITGTNPNPARVINLSLGGGGACSTYTQNAINAAVGAGAVVVVAAGNENADLDASGVDRNPAECNNVITVAATDQDGFRASYSNYGSTIEIAAPGGDNGFDPMVMSTLNTGVQGPVADSYGAYQGTSMATPHVAGVVSLMLSVNPGLSSAQVLSILQSTVTPFPAYSDCTTSICGAGILNAAKAVEEAARRVRTLSFQTASNTVNEAAGTVTIPVRLSVASSQAQTMNFTVAGTATGGADHNLAAGTVSFPAGTTSANISFTVTPDAAAEAAETVIVTLTAPGGATPVATLGVPSTHTVTILDGSAVTGPALSLSAASASESADTVSFTFTVQRTGTAQAAGVSYSLGAERVSGAKATLRTGTVELSAAEASKSVTLNIPRSELGVAAALEITLSQPTGGATLGAESARRVALAEPERVSLPLLAK